MKNNMNIQVANAKQVLGDIANIPKDLFSDAERERFAEILKGSVEPRPSRITLEQSDCAESPREWDNMGTFVSFDSRIPSDHDARSALIEAIESSSCYKKAWGDEWGNLENTEAPYLAQLLEQCDDIIWQFVYLYDHSSYALNTKGFSCRWDTSRIGIIFTTKATARENWGIKRITQRYIDWVKNIQDGEIKTLSQWVNGEVYMFTVYDQNDNILDSCCGFYGSDPKNNGMTDYLPDNWESLVDKGSCYG